MKVRARWLCSIVSVLILLGASVSNGDILSDFLTFDGPQHTPGGVPFQGGGEDKIQDDSLNKWFDLDRSGTLSIGDQIVSMITVSEINSSGRPSVGVGANSQIAFVSAAEIAGFGSGGSLRLAPIVGGPNSLGALLDPSIAGPANLNANSIGVAMVTGTPDSNPADDPLNWSYAQISNGATGFGNANGWSWSATLGMTPGAADFFELIGAGGAGLLRGGYSVQSKNFGGLLLPVDTIDFGLATHLNDATLDLGVFGPASGNEMARGWSFRGQATFYVNVIPEPVQGVVWTVLGFGVLMNRRRRISA
jgi:hypothetical protein